MKKSSKPRLITLGRVSAQTRASFTGQKVEFDNPLLRYD